jgi:hypothetical protein
MLQNAGKPHKRLVKILHFVTLQVSVVGARPVFLAYRTADLVSS